MFGQRGLPTEAATTRQESIVGIGSQVQLTSSRMETGTCKACCRCESDGVLPSSKTVRDCQHCIGLDWEGTNIGESLPTTFMFAAMRLFTGMGTYMDGQSAALDEAFVAITPGADVGAVVGVYAEVSDEVGFAIELLQRCGDWVSTRYDQAMGFQRRAITLGHDGQEQGNSFACWRAVTEARRSAAMLRDNLGMPQIDEGEYRQGG